MPITFYDECEALQLPSGNNGADGLSAVSQVKNFTTTIPQVDPSNLYVSGSLYASAVGVYGYEWLQVGVWFIMPGYGVFEVIFLGASTSTEILVYYKNRGTSINQPAGTVVPVGTLIVPSGPAGRSNNILSGSGAPSGSLGFDGDLYYDTGTDSIYGPKNNGLWGPATSLVGAAGPPGAPGISHLHYFSGSSQVLTTGTFTNLDTYALPAGTLTSDGDGLIIEAWHTQTYFNLAQQAERQITIGGLSVTQNSLFSTNEPAATYNGIQNIYRTRVEVVRTSATAVDYTVEWDSNVDATTGVASTRVATGSRSGISPLPSGVGIAFNVKQTIANSFQLKRFSIKLFKSV